MKINLSQLEGTLKKSLALVYLIAGEDITLKLEAFTQIRKAAKEAGFTERLRITSDYNWEQLYSDLYAVSLMGEKRIIELDFRSELPNKTAASILETYTNNPSIENLLIVDLDKLDYKITKSNWYSALEKLGVVIPVWPLQPNELPQWITNRAKKYKLQLNNGAVSLLSNYAEGNLGAAAQALEKIYLYTQSAENKNITVEDIEKILENEARFTLFDFIDHLISGNLSHSIKALNHLRLEDVEPIIILWSVSREMRLLSEYAELIQKGLSYEALFNKYKIFFRRQGLIKKVLTKFNSSHFLQVQKSLNEIDKIIKGAAPGNVWQSFEILCLRFSA